MCVLKLVKLLILCSTTKNQNVCTFVPITSPHEINIEGKCIKYANSETYLGHIINNSLMDDEDLKEQKRRLYARANSIIRKFDKCSAETRARLFVSFCTNIYLCSLWSNLTNSSLNSFKNAYSYSFDIIMKHEQNDVNINLYISFKVPDFNCLIRKSKSSLYYRILNSENSLISNILTTDIFYNSKILNNFRKIIF